MLKFLYLITLFFLPAISYALSSHFHIGGNYTYIEFKPKANPSFNGHLGGIQTGYDYREENALYEGVKLTYRQGKLSRSSSSRSIRDFDGQGRIGYTFQRSHFLLTPFTGFGWRYIRHNLKQTREFSLKFDFNEVYIPLGVYTDFCINPCFSIGLKGTWMPQVFSTVKIKPIGRVRWDLEKTLKNVMVELPLTYYFPRKNVIWSLQLNPFFQYWKDGKTLASTTRGTSLDLPSNIYKLWGAEINLGCSF